MTHTLDNRLLTCSKLVTKGGRAADIGTDHAYLPCLLVESGISVSAVAADINDGPLEAARLTVSRVGLSDKISVVKSDGLDSIPYDGITDVIIAGMGGELIFDIITRKSADWLKNGINLVLQPMSKDVWLYGKLCENGFEVQKQLFCEKGGFVYTVFKVKFTGVCSYPSEVEKILGKADLSDETAKKYMLIQASRLKQAGAGMKNSQSKKEQGEHLIEISNKVRNAVYDNCK